MCEDLVSRKIAGSGKGEKVEKGAFFSCCGLAKFGGEKRRRKKRRKFKFLLLLNTIQRMIT